MLEMDMNLDPEMMSAMAMATVSDRVSPVVADWTYASNPEIPIIQFDPNSGCYVELTNTGLDLQCLNSQIDMNGTILSTYEWNGNMNMDMTQGVGMGVAPAESATITEEAATIQFWAAAAASDSDPSSPSFESQIGVDYQNYNWGENYNSNATVGDIAVSNQFQAEFQAIAEFPQPQPEAQMKLQVDSLLPSSALEMAQAPQEKNQTQYSPAEALEDFNVNFFDFLQSPPPEPAPTFAFVPPLPPQKPSSRSRPRRQTKATANAKAHAAQLAAQLLGVSPENTRIDVQNMAEVMESAKKSNIDLGTLKVNPKVAKKSPGRARPFKRFVPPEEKTPEYYAKRAKNTQAARMSRDKKRVEENRLILHTYYLENKYIQLQRRLAELEEIKAQKLKEVEARKAVALFLASHQQQPQQQPQL